MSDRSRDDAKRFVAEYSDQDFYDAVGALELPTTKDVADAVGCSRSTASPRLHELADVGRLEVKKVGNAKVWEISD